MSNLRARAIYDFDAETEVELSLRVDEIVEILTQDGGDGWHEGRNNNGDEGYFPSSHVELIKEESSAPESVMALSPRISDDFEDEWNKYDDSGNSGNSSFNSRASVSSTFVHNEAYMKGNFKEKVPAELQINILEENRPGQYFWQKIDEPYTVMIGNSEEKSKYGGLKSFVTYRVIPSFTGKAVSRRYKHFDWLHKRLLEKFTFIPIPPIPEKQVFGNFEVSIIEQRAILLQKFADYMCLHPVLSKCSVWHHFLTVKDEKQWKQGKRNAERDMYQGTNFLATITAPGKELLTAEIIGHIEESKKYLQNLIKAVKLTVNVIGEISSKNSAEDSEKLANSFDALAKAFILDDNRVTTEINVSNALAMTAGMYDGVKKIYNGKVRKILFDFSSSLYVYNDILSQYPKIFQEYHKSQTTRQESIKMTTEQKLTQTELMAINRRTDIMFYGMIAELNHFRAERDIRLKDVFQKFLDDNVEFYSDIVENLKKTRKYYD